MSAHDTGGNAFPELDFSSVDQVGDTQYYSAGGLTIRDYFAAKAIQGMLAGGCTLDIAGEILGEKRAQTAYAIADAMLAERAK